MEGEREEDERERKIRHERETDTKRKHQAFICPWVPLMSCNLSQLEIRQRTS